MKFANIEQALNTFINIARAIYEIEYDEEIDCEATVSAQIDSTRKINITITMENLSEEK